MSYGRDSLLPLEFDDVTGIGESGDDDNDDDEDDDDDIPNNNKKSPNLVKLLNEFRLKWQQELEIGRGRKIAENNHWTVGNTVYCSNSLNENSRQACNEDSARVIFQQGIQAEQSGRLVDAVGYYRRAVQLVPDIESKIDYRTFILPQRNRTESESSVDSGTGDEEEEIAVKLRKLPVSESAICQPHYEPVGTHISALPVELMIMILKWVVSDDLDLISLEMVSMVCRGLYVCARDEELWKLVCTRVWGVNRGSCRSYRRSWRVMFIERPHLRFNGVYISKLSYMRQGEKNIDNFCNPWHVVEYYRYLRFFPDGVMLMLTSPEDPLSMVSKLRSRESARQGLLRGYYRMTGHTVTGVLKRVQSSLKKKISFRMLRNRQNTQTYTEQSFHVEFSVVSSGKRRCCRLVWTKYSVHAIRRPNDEEAISEFELSSKNYPPLYFSGVKSYTALSAGPLK